MIEEAFSLMARFPVPGCLCEFGVWQGAGLEQIEFLSRRDLGGNIPIFGFDSFEGMPPTSVDLQDNHKIVWRQGGFSDTSVEQVQKRVPDAKLIKSVFSDLPPLKTLGIDHIRFARLDCDIYEGYRDALRLMTPHIQAGTFLLFDESVPPPDPRYHDSIRDSGARAVTEWQAETGFALRILNSVWTECLAKVEVLK